MKNNELFRFLGDCIIAVAIIVAGCIIAFHLPDTTKVPSSLSVSTQSSQTQFGDYLSRYDVAGYLGISSDEADKLIDSGAIDSAIYKIGETYIISKSALQEWVEIGLSDKDKIRRKSLCTGNATTTDQITA